ncbi:DNA ligase [Hylemonella gracilis str. Niagara R]|uniref:DNA ligase n=1 Tax=Hylemonella gracilis str. Niagara R TaxID=1458275 RepID=A0A016XH06_9BURK|nr:DNA ligase [Hylemonella gracilis]EYC51384.1 DNA ligase [Hylemonella gracilis str. Niagara R]
MNFALRPPSKRCVVAVLMLCMLAIATVSAWSQNQPPRLLLAGEYRPDAQPSLHLPDYWVSEKFDGVRARWDGHQLVSRGGHRIHAPTWFTHGWPDQAMDGELWGGRGQFEETAGTVARITPENSAWKRLRFMVFDLPDHGGSFTERVAAMTALREGLRGTPSSTWLQIVEQRRVGTQAELDRLLDATVQAGGEGLMLHRGEARYRAGRGDDLLKVKPFQDAEAQVLSHLPGRGRHTGRMGALLVQTPDGRRFRLGTGFSDAQRTHPPPPGSWVSYRYRGLTADGLPRFAAFLRVRADAELMLPASDEAARR